MVKKNKNSFMLASALSPPPKKSQTTKVMKQTKVNAGDLIRDAGRKALLAGKRISKSGKVYWETRQNRSDAPNKKI